MTRLLTTGWFPAHFSGNGTTLYLLVSSFQTQTAVVPYRVNVLQADGSQSTLQEGEFAVPGGQTGRVAIDGVDGRTLEVELRLPSDGLAPSLALVGTFAADGAESTLVWVSPRGFVPRSSRSSRPSHGAAEAADEPPSADASTPPGSSGSPAQPRSPSARDRSATDTMTPTAITKTAERGSVVFRPAATRRTQRFIRKDGRRHPQRGGSNHA